VISHEADSDRWVITPASDLAGDFTPDGYVAT
jgi:hypothetical protein